MRPKAFMRSESEYGRVLEFEIERSVQNHCSSPSGMQSEHRKSSLFCCLTSHVSTFSHALLQSFLAGTSAQMLPASLTGGFFCQPDPLLCVCLLKHSILGYKHTFWNFSNNSLDCHVLHSHNQGPAEPAQLQE